MAIYLFEKTPKQISQNNTSPSQNIDVGSVNSIENTSNDDWKKILVSIGQSSTTVLTNQNPEVFDGTTITSQVAKDFFSQYLLAKGGGGTVTVDMANKISDSVLSNTNYTQINGPIYIAENLHIKQEENLDIIKSYKTTLNLILKTRSTQVTDSPVTAINKATKAGGQDALLRLDSTISIAKGLVSDLLQMNVPKSAVSAHLALLNATSDVVSDLEAMRVAFTDPIRGLAGIGQYNSDMIKFQNALIEVNKYLAQKTGSNI
nr:hypothetical protein [uncultured archaeon]